MEDILSTVYILGLEMSNVFEALLLNYWLFSEVTVPKADQNVCTLHYMREDKSTCKLFAEVYPPQVLDSLHRLAKAQSRRLPDFLSEDPSCRDGK